MVDIEDGNVKVLAMVSLATKTNSKREELIKLIIEEVPIPLSRLTRDNELSCSKLNRLDRIIYARVKGSGLTDVEDAVVRVIALGIKAGPNVYFNELGLSTDVGD